MKKGQIFEGIVEYADFPNKAVAVINSDPEENGNKVIVKNSIPGQTVKFAINKKRGEKCEGRLLEVIKDSPFETNERCEHFRLCGGCVYQSMDYNEQLKMKKEQVEKIVSQVIKDDYEFEGIIGSPVKESYRNKMEFTFGDEVKGGDLALGLHKRNSMYDIVSVTKCKIVDEDYRKILTCVLDYFKEKNVPYYHKVTHEGYLRHLLVRKAVKTKQILIDLVTSTQIEMDLSELSDKLKSLELDGEIKGFLHTFNDGVADVVKNEKTDIIFGQDYIEEELLGLKFKITAFSFFQTNSLGAEVLYSKAREYVGSTKDKIVYDLYSGTGTIAQILAPVAKRVIGVEIIEEAVVAARENAKLNGLDNCEFIADDVLTALDGISERPDFIMLDPPRDGVHPKALSKIIDYGVDSMVYISCKPTSLARDLVILQERGYKVEKVCCVDMFPNTVHVETCVLLGRKQIDNIKYTYIDYEPQDAEYLKNMSGSATYDEIREWIKQKYGFHVTNLNIAQIKDKCGFEKRENYNKGAENHRVPNCTSEKEKAIIDAFKHFKMY